jgi:low affinity Fe/Cu permease
MRQKEAITSPIVELSGLAKAAEEEDIEMGAAIGQEVKHMFFDNISVQFHFGAFFYQLAAHIFLPAFPCMINSAGQISTNMYTWTTPILAYMMVITYALCDGGSVRGMEGAVFIPLIYYLQHRLLIAMKYGSMSTTEYKKFMKCKDKEICSNYRGQVELMSGWMMFHPDVIHFELAAASARIGARINDIHICIASVDCGSSALNQLRAWNAFLRGHDVIDFSSPPCRQLRALPDGNFCLSVYDLCEGLVQKSMKYGDQKNAFVGNTINTFAIMNLMIPIVMICYFFEPPADIMMTLNMITFYMSSTMVNYVYACTFYGLLYIAIVDVFRQLSMMSDLNSMIRLTDIMLYAELSSISQELSERELDRVYQRVAEIISIKGSSEAYVPVKYEDPDEDAPDIYRHESREPNESSVSKQQGTAGAHVAPAVGAVGRSCVLGERIYRDNEAHWLPRLSFDESHNIAAWTHARLVMQNFGERFHFRLELYVGAAIAMVLLMMILGLLHLGLSDHRMQTFLTPWCLQSLLSVTMCIAFLVTIIQTGAQVNSKMEQHSQTMCSHALRLNRKAENLRVALFTEADKDVREDMERKIEKLNAVAEKLEAMRTIIETNTVTKPFRIFGFTAQSSLTISVLTTAFSFYAILFSLLSNRGSQALSSVAV